jgi:hypothetical protein
MTVDDRIKGVMKSLIWRFDDPDLPHEIRGLLNLIDAATYRGHIGLAIEYAEIYINPKKLFAWEPHAREKIGGFLLQDLSTAAEIAREFPTWIR